MRWTCRVETDIAQLAWIVRVKGTEAAAVCGSGVLLGTRSLHDGVWAGPLEQPPGPTDHCVGTGISAGAGELVITTSETPRDRVLLFHTDGSTFASNSLPLLLAAIDDDLDPSDLSYRGRFQSMERSMRRSGRRIRTAAGRHIRLVVGETAMLTGSGEMNIVPRPATWPFTDYTDYRTRLDQVTEALIANATDRRRPIAFEPTVTMSAGYDSTAVAALVARAGVSEGLTLTRDGAVDHPGEIAACLGIDLREVQRGSWLTGPGRGEAELAAASVSLMDTVFLGLEEEMAGKLVFTGASGDTMWGRSLHRVRDDDVIVPTGSMGGRGLAEHRLRVGYVMCALPDFGHLAHRSLVRIGRTAEMEPWSVGGSYDRPIARRIAEEAGVARESFGQRKHTANAGVGISNHVYGATTREGRRAELEAVMSPAATDSFLDFVDRHEDRRSRRSLAARKAMAKLDRVVYTVDAKLLGPLAERGVAVGVPRRIGAWLGRWGKGATDHTAWLPHWGISELRKTLPEITFDEPSLAQDPQGNG